MFDGKQGARRVGDVSWRDRTTAGRRAGRLPLIARHVEVGTQRPPHIARIDTVLDGLDGGPSSQLGKDVIHHDRGAANSSELPVNEFAELRQSHAYERTQNSRRTSCAGSFRRWVQSLGMNHSRRSHRFTVLAAGLVITGLGLTAGCAAAKESPSPTGNSTTNNPTTSKVDSKTNVKRPGTGDN